MKAEACVRKSRCGRRTTMGNEISTSPGQISHRELEMPSTQRPVSANRPAGASNAALAEGGNQPQSFDRTAPRLRLAMEMAKVMAFEFDFRTGKGTFDPADPNLDRLCIRQFEDVFKTLPPSYHELAKAKWNVHLETGASYVVEYQLPSPTGEIQWHMSACEAVKDESGAVIGMIGMRQDITARKLAEEEIMAEGEAARAADKAKSEFLANM